jgi:hypothetical protein
VKPRPLALALAALATLLVPGVAYGGLATLQARDVALAGGGRTLASSQTPGRFELVGLHWQGSGTVSFRTRSLAGAWSAWQAAAPEGEDVPDRRSRESAATRGWKVGNPWWVGPSNRIEYRMRGRVTALRSFFVRSRASRVLRRAIASVAAPQIVPRAGWSADESLVRQPPQTAASLRYVVVHHTAGRNGYAREDVPAILRAIQVFHVRANAWNDIGYNFLVDRFGTVYEGRAGGVTRNVVGAHALGFNTGSSGVAVLGDFEGAQVSPAAEAAVARVVAWRLDAAHVDPLTTMTVVSGGSDRFPSGIPVFLRAVSGHRDTGFTACPGASLYARLGSIANAAATAGLPKLYGPAVTTDRGLVRFRARLSSPLTWTVAVTDAAGLSVATGRGSGADVDWAWDSRLSGGTGLRWRISAPGVTPATGVLGALAPVTALAISGAAADPETITPNGDGQADTATVTYTTTAPARVEAVLLDPLMQQLAELMPATQQPPGEHVLSFDGLGLPDGAYTIRITATGGRGAVVARDIPVLVTRTLARVAVAPAVFTPNGDGRRDALRVSFRLRAPASVKVRLLRSGTWVATAFSGALAPGPQLVLWNGAKRLGFARDGDYTVSVEAFDAVGTASVALPFVKDATSPRVRLVRGAKPLLRVSEPATLTVRVNGAVRRLRVREPGTLQLRGIRTVHTLAVVARDDAGNVTRYRIP